MVTGSSAWHDMLDVLAERGDDEQRLAVWAARCADANGDTAEAERWATAAAQCGGSLF